MTNRVEFFDYLETNMRRTSKQLEEDGRLEYKHNMLKSIILESNIDLDQFTRMYELERVARLDDTLHQLRYRTNGHASSFFIDSRDPRFWYIFTFDESQAVVRMVNNFMSSVRNGLDHLWFSGEFQKELSTLGVFKGMGVKFKANKVFPEEYLEKRFRLSDLSIRSWGEGTKRLFETLSESRELRNFIPLSNIGIKRVVNGDFVAEDIKYDGSFTTRGGNSIQLHLDLLDTIRDRYKSLLGRIEARYRIGYRTTNGRASVMGRPLVIGLNNEIDDIDYFIDHIVSAKNPFRLWGLKSRLANDYFKVKGIDLHNGDNYTMEVTPEWIRLYLDERACGNTALRIFANIQRYYDSTATMEV